MEEQDKRYRLQSEEDMKEFENDFLRGCETFYEGRTHGHT
jgi:hypothetical protein